MAYLSVRRFPALIAHVSLPRKKFFRLQSRFAGAPTGVFFAKSSFRYAAKNHSRSRRIGPPRVAGENAI